MNNDLKNLWIAVLSRAAQDALSSTEGTNRYKLEAISWFTSKNEDFKRICSFADRDPQYVHEKLVARLNEKSTVDCKYFNRLQIKKRSTVEYNTQAKNNKKLKKLWFLEKTWKHIRYLKYAQYAKN